MRQTRIAVHSEGLTARNAPEYSPWMRFLDYWCCALAAGLFAAETAAQESVSFSNQIAPVLAEKCLTCHGPGKSKGGYRVDSFERLVSPGSSEQAPVVPGEPQASELFRRLIATDEADRMPQDAEPLPTAEIELFRDWIAQGAKLDKGSSSTPITSLLPERAHPAPPADLPNPVPVLALAFDSSGARLAVGGYHQVRVKTLLEKAERIITNVVQRVHAIAFHPDGKSLVVVGGEPGRLGEVSIYDLETGVRRNTPVRTPDEMLCLAISPDGKQLAVGGTDNTIHLIQWDNFQPSLRIEQHADWVMALDFSDDGKRLASASRDRTARVYDAGSGELITTYVEHGSPVTAVAMVGSDKVVSGAKDGAIHLWKVENGKTEYEPAHLRGATLSLIDEGEKLLLLAGREITGYDLNKRSVLNRFAHPQAVCFSMAFHPASGMLAAGTIDGRVLLWAESGEKTAEVLP